MLFMAVGLYSIGGVQRRRDTCIYPAYMAFGNHSGCFCNLYCLSQFQKEIRRVEYENQSL